MLDIARDGPLAILTFNRPDKRNAMSDALLAQIDAFFTRPPEGVKVVILTGAGGNFCAGLDLSEHAARPEAETVFHHSRGWHAAMDRIQFGGLPVVSALSGAVIGGGRSRGPAPLGRAAHDSAYFQVPEGRRGIFIGGGASVRVGRILGADRMTEMMLTGRKYAATEGLALGLAHYVVPDAMATARELALQIAGNAPLSNFIMIQALARIGDMGRGDGLFTESLCAALTQTSTDAREGLTAFLQKRDPRFRE